MLFQADRVYNLLGGFLSSVLGWYPLTIAYQWSRRSFSRRIYITYIDNELLDELFNSASCLAFGKQAPGSAPGGIFLHAICHMYAIFLFVCLFLLICTLF